MANKGVKKTGINGVEQAAAQAQTSRAERLEANMDYVAMMCDVEIPEESEGGSDEQ